MLDGQFGIAAGLTKELIYCYVGKSKAVCPGEKVTMAKTSLKRLGTTCSQRSNLQLLCDNSIEIKPTT